MTVPAWVIVQTKPSSEELTERQFRLAGYRVYVPRYRKLLLPHGRGRAAVSEMRPLFSRLVFVQDWRGWPAISITGAAGLMQSGSDRAQLSDSDVALIMQRERAGDFDMARPRGDGKHLRLDLAPGDHVEFEATLGARVIGVLEEMSPNGKAIVWAVLFDRIVKTNVDAETLQKVAV